MTMTTTKLVDIQIHDNPEKQYPDISLELLLGKKIKQIRGMITDPFGNVPIYLLTYIEFEDGTDIRVQAEMDIAYLPYGDDENFPMLSEDNMMNLWCESNPEECEDDLEGNEGSDEEGGEKL